MKTVEIREPSLDELAATAVRRGRELAKKAHDVYLGGNARDFAIVDRALSHLARREPFDPRVANSLDALTGILEGDMASEVVGTERQFVETGCDVDGVYGEVHERSIYSERGMALLELKQTLEDFVEARDATLDRVAAENILSRLMGPPDPAASLNTAGWRSGPQAGSPHVRDEK